MTLTLALLEAGRHLYRRPCVWRRRIETREQLGVLSPGQLRDVGLDPEVVAREVRKPFWQPLGVLLGEAAAKSPPPEAQVPRALRPASTFSAVLLPWRS